MIACSLCSTTSYIFARFTDPLNRPKVLLQIFTFVALGRSQSLIFPLKWINKQFIFLIFSAEMCYSLVEVTSISLAFHNCINVVHPIFA